MARSLETPGWVRGEGAWILSGWEVAFPSQVVPGIGTTYLSEPALVITATLESHGNKHKVGCWFTVPEVGSLCRKWAWPPPTLCSWLGRTSLRVDLRAGQEWQLPVLFSTVPSLQGAISFSTRTSARWGHIRHLSLVSGGLGTSAEGLSCQSRN
jgi:hypothetical protein